MKKSKPKINSIFYNPKNLNHCEITINDEKATYMRYDDFEKYINGYIEKPEIQIKIKKLIKEWHSFIFFIGNQKIIEFELDIDTSIKELKIGKTMKSIKTEIKNKHEEFLKKRYDPKKKVKDLWKKDLFFGDM